jgi:hypothetical protein
MIKRMCSWVDSDRIQWRRREMIKGICLEMLYFLSCLVSSVITYLCMRSRYRSSCLV